ncbi:MAG: hypothetical protein HGA63_05150 [Syntrophobacteraceae bacterium]|nr:hypothetical protein [Syntrophobacteraceae bacterium]
MEEKRCAHCGCPLDLNPRVKNQRYCGKKECQRARKRLWQKGKMATDPDYRANQQECNKAWRGRNPDYWSHYRKNHPRYVERNRLLQKARRRRCVAKMDASGADSFVRTGTYWLIPEDGVAKMDAFARKVVLVAVT